ncbi:MAG: NHL repeat-containing protein [Nitrospinae bacterium]|nr:NHL repeat-containing protein [Nitrospinota bacterium]
MKENIRYAGEFRTKGNESLSPPSGIIADKNKNIIIVDEFNHRIQIYDASGNLINSFGKKGNGDGEFYYPKGIAVDSEGFFYVADCWNHRVQKFSHDANKDGSWKFINSFGSYGDDVGKFNEPYDIAINKDRIYVLDRCNHRIQVFDKGSNLHGIIGQRGTVIEEDLAELFDTPLTLFSSPAFEFPTGISVDSSGNIYIADSGNHRVVKLRQDGEVLLTFGQKGSNPGEFQYPHDIAIDRNDTIFISDLNNNRIQAFTPQGNFISLIDTGKDKSDKLSSPTALSIDNNGRLYSGMGFDTRVIIFEYKIEVKRQESEAKNEEVSDISLICNKVKEVEDEIVKIKNERIGFSYDYISRTIIKENNILNPPKEDINFDEMLHSHEKNDRALLRNIRYKLLIHKRLFRNSCSMVSTIISEEKPHPEAAANLINNSISQLIKEAHILLGFLEERRKYENEAEKFFKDESRSKEENWRDFRIAIRKSDIIQEILPHIYSSTNLSIIAVKKLLMAFPAPKFPTLYSELLKGKDIFAKIILYSSGIWEYILPIEENIKEILGMIPESPNDKGDEKSPIHFSNLPLNLIINDLTNTIFMEGRGINGKGLEVIDWKTNLSVQQAQDNIESIKNGLEKLLQEREKIGVEITKIDNSLAHLPAREEKMRLPLLNNKILWGFHDRLNQIQIGGLLTAYQILSSILIYLYKTTASGETNKKVSELLEFYENQMALASKIKRQGHEEEVGCKAELDRIIFSVNNDKGKEIELRNRIFNAARKTQFTNIYSRRIRGGLTLYRQHSALSTRHSAPKFDMLFGNYGKGAGEFNLPGAIISDNKGNLYISDEMNYRIQKFNKDGEFILSFGGFGTIESKFKMPAGIALDKNGDILISDWINHRIQKFSPDGSFISCFGKYGSSNAEFNRPSRIAVDEEGCIYVADLGNKRIQKFNQDGEFIMSFRKEIFKEPFAVYISPKQEIIVGELNGDRIAIFKKDGNFVKTIGGEGTGDGKFLWIGAIAGDKDKNIYIADFWNSRIQIFSKDLKFISSFGKFGRGIGEFDCIPSLAIADEFLFACDYFNHRIQRFRIDVKE